MLFRSKKTKKSSARFQARKRNRVGQRIARFKSLERRRLLAAFDLELYEDHDNFNFADEGDTDYSGVAYNYDTNRIYVVDNKNKVGPDFEETNIYEYDLSGTLIRTIDLGVATGSNVFHDPEGIVYLGIDDGDFLFAVVEEGLGIINEIHIPDGTDDITINKADAGTSTETISPSISTFSTDNKAVEGIAWDGADTFYVVDEKGTNIGVHVIDRADGSTADPVDALDIDLVAGRSGFSDPMTDMADVYYDNGFIFVLSQESRNIVKVRLSDNLIVGQYPKSNQNPIAKLPFTDAEGLAFSPDGFDMFVVGEPRQFRHYRNYTGFTPNAAPDLVETAPLGGPDLTDNLTKDTTPEFTGTLTRSVGGNTVPLDAAWVFLYIDGSPTGDSAETDENGAYSITPATPLDYGDYRITIKVGEEDDTLDERPENLSVVSAELGIVIHPTAIEGDLTGNGAIDFEDLTVLLANWNSDVSWAEGNLAGTFDTPGTVDFNDLTLLLTAWTGPQAAGDPQKALATPSEDYTDTVYSTSTDFFVQFDAAVTGVDATDLELSGTGGGGASVGTPSDLGANVWKFPVTGLSIGTVDVDVAPDEDDITYTSGGAWVGLKEWTFITLPGVTFTSRALVIDGTSGADTITVDAAGGDLTLNGAKVDMGSGDIAASAVTSILIEGYAGDDTIDLSAVTGMYALAV